MSLNLEVGGILMSQRKIGHTVRKIGYAFVAAVSLLTMVWMGSGFGVSSAKTKSSPSVSGSASPEGTGTIYTNTPLATGATTAGGTAAPVGTQWSEVQNDTGNTTESNTTLGTSCSVTTATVFRCADNFTVPAGQTWTIDRVIVYVYQTGFAGTTSPITAGTLQIWNGRPGDGGSTVIFGDTTTNRLGTSSDALMFRTSNSLVPTPTVPGTTRKIWETNLTVSPALALTAGTYWVDWNTSVSGLGAHFAPPGTVVGARTQPGWNARQFTGTAWQDSLDTGNPATAPDVALDFPFKLGGTTAAGLVATDFDGDGKADFTVVRPPALSLGEGDQYKSNNDVSRLRGREFRKSDPAEQNLGGPGTGLSWWIKNSGNGSVTNLGHGTSTTDRWVPEDYDGDGKVDIAVWRSFGATGPGGASFFVLNSSNSTVTEVDFGVSNDNPTVVGDYDGDGKADPAVYRCSFPSTNGQCTYFYLGSLNNPGGNITYVPWGNNASADMFPNRGDFDGDGKLDFCIQRPRTGGPTGQAEFVLLRSSDGGIEYINWDTTSALIAPGDYDGDGKSDIMTVRVVSGSLLWSLLTRTGATSFTQWGTTSISGTSEFLAPADFDGDGKTDITVYRRNNSNADDCFFHVRRSTDSALQSFEWGSTTDRPVNGWDVQ